MALSVPLSLLLVTLLCPVFSLYFHMWETDVKCFVEEVPDETMISGRYFLSVWDRRRLFILCLWYFLADWELILLFAGKYKVELYDDKTESFIAKDGIGMHVEIKDPEKKPILSKYYTNEGQFVFTTHSPGEHYICLSPNSTRWFTGGNRLVS